MKSGLLFGLAVDPPKAEIQIGGGFSKEGKMRISVALLTFFMVVAVNLFLTARPTQAVVPYTLKPLGFLPGSTSELSHARDLNNQGQVVGNALDSTRHNRPFFWESGKGMTDLGALPNGYYTIATGINDLSQVVGMCEGTSYRRAFLWERETGLVDLNDYMRASNYNWSLQEATAINNSRQVIGRGLYYNTGLGFLIQDIWDPGRPGGLKAISGYPIAINNSGQIAGYYRDVSGATRAYLYTPNSGYRDLGVLPRSWASYAWAINELGHVVGYSGDPGSAHAFLWRPETEMLDLGLLSGATYSLAEDISNANQVVGSSGSGVFSRAFLWTQGTGMLDLNGLLDSSGYGWTLSQATAINDAGQIAGVGRNPAGQDEAFLLTPIPEPSSLLALICGIGGLGGLCLRKKR